MPGLSELGKFICEGCYTSVPLDVVGLSQGLSALDASLHEIDIVIAWLKQPLGNTMEAITFQLRGAFPLVPVALDLSPA